MDGLRAEFLLFYSVRFAIDFLSMCWGRTGLSLRPTTGGMDLPRKSLGCGRQVGLELMVSQMADENNGKSCQLLASHRVI